MRKYNLSRIMKRAWELVRNGMTISAGLKKAWEEAKNMVKQIKNAVIKHFYSYNARRYSTPWVCLIKDGSYDFSEKIGTYTGSKGDEGDLIVSRPVTGQIYGWGQKDYRGGNTEKNFVKWDGSQFIECDKFGYEK